MNIDFSILMALIAFSGFVAVLGFWMQRKDEQTIIPALSLFVSASLFFFLFATIDNVIVGYNNETDNIAITETVIGNTTVMHYQVESGTTNRTIANIVGQQQGMAEGAASAVSMLVRDRIQCVDINIAKVGNPSVAIPIIVGFYSNTNTPILEIARVNVTQVTTQFAWIEGLCVQEGEEVTIQNGIKVGITYAGGDASNFLRVREDTSNPFDLTETTSYQNANGATSWVVVASRDLNMRMYDNEIQFQINEVFTNSVSHNLVDMSELKYYFLVIATFLMLTAVYSVKLYKGQGSGEYIDSL